MKVGTLRTLLNTWVILFVLSLLGTFIWIVPAFQNAQEANCHMLQSGLGQLNPTTPTSQPMTAEYCLQMVENFWFPRVFIGIVGSALVSAFLVFPALLLFASGLSLISKAESRHDKDMREYGEKHFVTHLLSLGKSRDEVEKTLKSISRTNKSKLLYIQQYIDTLPAEDRDAAVKRLIP